MINGVLQFYRLKLLTGNIPEVTMKFVFTAFLILLFAPMARADKNDLFVETALDFVQKLSDHQFQEAARRFDTRMRALTPPEKLEQIWDQLTTQTGDLDHFYFSRSERIQNYLVVYVTCVFRNAQLDAKIVFNPRIEIGGLFFLPVQSPEAWQAPEYADTTSFEERELSLGGDQPLPAVLTLPKKKGTFAAVILIHGSGPLDMDETIGPNKPFKDLAWGLASAGIAVLRYTKRTKAYPEEIARSKTFTVQEETIDDVLQAIRLLKSQPQIDSTRIVLVGHSLGAMLIPRIAVQAPGVCAFVMMAAPVSPLEDLIVKQLKYVFMLDGKIDAQEKQQLQTAIAQRDLIRSSRLTPETPKDQLPFNSAPDYWLDLKKYHPIQMAKKMTHPLLILQGGRDYQTPPAEFHGWQTALKGHANVTLKQFPELNHLFMAGRGKSKPVEYLVPGHVAPQVVREIAEWIQTKCGN